MISSKASAIPLIPPIIQAATRPLVVIVGCLPTTKIIAIRQLLAAKFPAELQTYQIAILLWRLIPLVHA